MFGNILILSHGVFIANLILAIDVIQATIALENRSQDIKISEHPTIRQSGGAAVRLFTGMSWVEGSRRQQRMSPDHQFPCWTKNIELGGSATTSVHRLRPRDVSVVATLGDSLVTGLGALAESIPELFRLDQGVSWSIGGDEDWHSTVTLPNILRQFNPRLVGFASASQHTKHFGMGVPQSHDEDLLQQAKNLVIAMHNDSRVNVKHDWKLVTVITGHNDLCSGKPCFPDPDEAAQEHGYNLRRALDFLRDNLPRTFVSLLPVLDVTAGWSIEKSLLCRVMSVIECRCLYASGNVNRLNWMKKLVNAFHRVERELVESGRYDKRDDFTVELQTFTEKLVPPRARNFLGFDLTDLSLFSVDCFHLSQKGHAAFATMQWNNQLEPEGNKTHEFLWPLQHLACPSESAPYFFTRRNSRTFRRFGHQ